MSGFINYICDDVRDVTNGFVNVYQSTTDGSYQEFGAIWNERNPGADDLSTVYLEEKLIYRIRVKWKGLS